MKYKAIISGIFIFLLVTPLLFWDNLYLVGGDDTKLYYLFPYEYFKNFTLNLISDNTLGIMGYYFPQQIISGFSLVVALVRWVFPWVNTMLLLFGANFALGFLFFYLFLGLFIPGFKNENVWIKIAASLLYVYSGFTMYSLWQSQLFSVYLVAIFPLALYLFFRGVIEKRFSFIVIDALFISVFSIVILSIPWLAALLIVTAPILVWLFLEYKQRFLKYLLALLGLIIFLNIYWIIHFAYSPFSSDQGNGFISNVVSTDFRKDNRATISGVSVHNSVLYPFFEVFHRRIQEDYAWHTLSVYSAWSLPVMPLNIIFIAVIFSAFFLLRKQSLRDKRIYLAVFLGFLLGLYFFTVKIGSLGVDIFIWMNNTIPTFTMFRNMFDKFGLALGFAYAFVFGLSLKIVIKELKSDFLKKLLLGLVFIVILLNAYPIIKGLFFLDRPLWQTESIYVSLNDFNEDFYSLVNYLKEMQEPSRFLWIPWQDTNYIEIQDSKLSDHYYVGVSPLVFLAKKVDFTGRLGTPPAIGASIVDALYNNDYKTVSENFRKLNSKYIIVKNEIPETIANTYLYNAGEGSIFYHQGEAFKEVILGDKIKDFGKRYSLYKINDKFKNEKIYLTSNINVFPESFPDVFYEKNKSYEYTVQIRNLKKKENLIFLDAYHKQWDLLFRDREIFLGGGQQFVFDYANGWEIDPELIKENYESKITRIHDDGSIDLDITLYFQPQKYMLIGLIISGITLVICISFLFHRMIILVKKKKKYDK